MTSVALPEGVRSSADVPARPRCSTLDALTSAARVDPERHDLPEEPLGPPHDSRVVGVGDEDIVGVRSIENLGLGIGDRVSRLEEPEVRVAHIGPHADVGLRDADQRANLSRMIHAQFDDCDLRPRAQLEQRERQADVVVEIPLVPEDAMARRQKLRGDFLGRRLARASRDRHDLGTRPPPYLTRDVLQRRRRVVDSNHDRPRRQLVSLRQIARHDDSACSPRQHVGHEVVAVEPLALDGDEAIASLERSRIDHDPPDRGRPIPMDDLVRPRRRRHRPRSARAAPRAMTPATGRDGAPARSSRRPRRRTAARRPPISWYFS